ncbi:cell division control protein 68 [Enterocytozoon bieneusi H348]|nr:cell division control protein 68 [Enterocytozoon bieneusi H348]|eukprot:XP_001827930.1 cell division control protein 68 [Enterocytozoon bieneusi H348]
MNQEVILNKDLFFKRINKILTMVSNPLIIMLGKRADVEEFALNSALFNYLLGFEFSETIVIIKEQPIIFTSQKKAAIIEQLGSGVKIIINNSKEDPNSLNKFQNMLKETYSVVDRNNIKGQFCNIFLNGIKFIEITEKILQLFIIKEEDEINIIHKAGIIGNYLLKKGIELCRDDEFTQEHLEKFMNDPIKDIDPSLIEFSTIPQYSNTSLILGIRYKGYCIEIGRPFLCDLTEEYEIQKYVLECMKPGKMSNEILQYVNEFIDEKDIDKTVSLFTIGLLPYELDFRSNFKLEKNMCFVLRIGNCFVNTFILSDSPIFITLKDTAEDYSISRMKFRNKTNEHEIQLRLKEHQKELLDKLINDMIIYYKENEINPVEQKKESKITPYISDASIPRSKIINWDLENFYVIIPILSYSIPIHISNIKNVAISANNKLRINLKESKEIKEITSHMLYDTNIKSFSIITNNAEDALIAINEMKKLYNKPKIEIKTQGMLKEKYNPSILSDLLMKTDQKLISRKITGNLELHDNGFKYLEIHFLFNNIKSIFYQFGDFEEISLIHFNFKKPILINDKPTKNLQFHKKQNNNYHDTTRRESEAISILKQEEEEEEIIRINKELSDFIEKIENETIFRPQLLQKGFIGVYHKESSPISITSNCLVCVSETPFFILYLDEVEIINLERVTYATKTFDCVFIFKDKTKHPFTISAIETTKLPFIKTTFDSLNLVFMETKFNINWNNLMATIMKNPLEFYETGGWSELLIEEPTVESSSIDSDSESVISSTIDSTDDDDDNSTAMSSDASSETIKTYDSDDNTSSFVESDSSESNDNKKKKKTL